MKVTRSALQARRPSRRCSSPPRPSSPTSPEKAAAPPATRPVAWAVWTSKKSQRKQPWCALRARAVSLFIPSVGSVHRYGRKSGCVRPTHSSVTAVTGSRRTPVTNLPPANCPILTPTVGAVHASATIFVHKPTLATCRSMVDDVVHVAIWRPDEEPRDAPRLSGQRVHDLVAAALGFCVCALDVLAHTDVTGFSKPTHPA